jgi:asparagine synthase (glutamine-hydrolysing)
MCGIVGFFGTQKNFVSRQSFEKAAATLVHRGPDAQGILWQPDRGLALGHTRLSIIDPEARSDQPFLHKNLSLVFNGEIYNYPGLRVELLELGARFKTNCDTEVIVQGYEYWGVKVFDRLRGMYALALHDAQRDRLHLIRDEFGIKPLYLFQQGNNILFASEIKALAQMTSLSINDRILVDMLRWGFQMEDASLYLNVRHLTPGNLLTVHLTSAASLSVDEQECWSAKRAYMQPISELADDSLYKIIQHSVDEHLIADVPVALALSGGLDSSVVAAAAATSHPDIHAYTYTLNADTDADQEVAYAKLVCRHLGLKHHIVRLKTHNTEGWLRLVAWHLEEPIANINALLSYGLAQVIKAQGFKVVLVGEGADELFAGYPWYRFALEPKLSQHPGAIFNAYRSRRMQTGLTKAFRPASQEIANQQDAITVRAFNARLAEIPDSPLNGFLSFDQSTQLQYSQLLRVDKMFMAHGVEARVPFLYRSVLDASAALSRSRKCPVSEIHRRDEKIVLANAFAKRLPPSVISRPKFGEKGTVNVWDSTLADGLDNEFKRCLYSEESKASRQILDGFIDWQKISSMRLSSKGKFMISLTIETVSSILLAQKYSSEPSPVSWEILE